MSLTDEYIRNAQQKGILWDTLGENSRFYVRYDAKPHSNEPIIPTGWEEEDEDDIPHYYKDILVKPDEPKRDNSST